MMETPFAIGDEMWLPQGQPILKTIPCPVCDGAKAVTVIMGNGEHVNVECDCCGKGHLDGPRGVIKQWMSEPSASRFVISGVSYYHDGRWEVTSTTGGTADFSRLRSTEAEAFAASEQACREHEEAVMRSRQHQRKQNAQQATWSVQYHRKHIADLEREIGWHRARIEAAKTPVPA